MAVQVVDLGSAKKQTTADETIAEQWAERDQVRLRWLMQQDPHAATWTWEPGDTATLALRAMVLEQVTVTIEEARNLTPALVWREVG
jgi:hypothetical protein